MSDAELLQRYIRDRADDAFAEIVHRHVDFVYALARRQTGSANLAEDVAQSVFVELAQRAERIKTNTPLVAWLHVVTRRTGMNAVRDAARRQAREAAAADLAADEVPADKETQVSAMEPLIDEVLEALDPIDRAAVILRFFENKSFRDVGAALRLSDDAAQKRVSRALDRTRKLLLRRGAAVSAAALAGNLSAHAAVTAPPTLAHVICHASRLGVTAAAATSATVPFFVMTTAQKSIAWIAFAAVTAVGIYESSTIARQSVELDRLERQVDRNAKEIAQLGSKVSQSDQQLKAVDRAIDGRLAAAKSVTAADAALVSQMEEWLGKVQRLKELFTRRPELAIPELKFLSDDDWLKVASSAALDSEDALRKAMAGLRHTAENRAIGRIQRALAAYVREHDGMLPTAASELLTYVEAPIDSAIMARYTMLQSGKASDVQGRDAMRLMTVGRPADPEYDSEWYFGLNGFSSSSESVLESSVVNAERQFAAQHGGQRASTAGELLPYMKITLDPVLVQRQIDGQSANKTP